MHTWEHGRTIFTGNSDFSGDIIVTNPKTGSSMTVPAVDILAVAARFARGCRIAQMEQLPGDHEAELQRLEAMDDHLILGVPKDDWPHETGTDLPTF